MRLEGRVAREHEAGHTCGHGCGETGALLVAVGFNARRGKARVRGRVEQVVGKVLQ